jgi:amino acid transporter
MIDFPAGRRPGAEEVRLSREMSGFSVTMIGVGAMIGAGIFVLTGIAAGVAGPGLLLAFGLNGIVTLFTAMAYAKLGSCFHDAGGGYLWVKSSLPIPTGSFSGWMSWFAHAVACSLYALGFGAYFGHVLEGFDVHVPRIPYLSIEKTLAVAALRGGEGVGDGNVPAIHPSFRGSAGTEAIRREGETVFRCRSLCGNGISIPFSRNARKMEK